MYQACSHRQRPLNSTGIYKARYRAIYKPPYLLQVLQLLHRNLLQLTRSCCAAAMRLHAIYNTQNIENFQVFNRARLTFNGCLLCLKQRPLLPVMCYIWQSALCVLNQRVVRHSPPELPDIA